MENFKRISCTKVCSILGVSRDNLTFQVRSGKGPLAKLGFYVEPRPGIKKGQYVFFEETVTDFIKNQRWAE